MFPLFVEHPYLWKIILHFGNTRQWRTLDELFAHLHSQADDSYALPLQKLNTLLLKTCYFTVMVIFSPATIASSSTRINLNS